MGVWRLARFFKAGPRAAAAASPAAHQPMASPEGDDVADGDEPPRGCGWFDSSQDLRSGLAVIEHDTIDVHQSLRLWYAADPAAA